MKGNQDIPDDWAVCEAGLNEEMTQEKYDEDEFCYYPKFRSVNSNL